MVVYVCDNLHTRLRRLRMHIISIIDLPAGRPKYLALCMAYCFMRPESRIIKKYQFYYVAKLVVIFQTAK